MGKLHASYKSLNPNIKIKKKVAKHRLATLNNYEKKTLFNYRNF